MPGFVLFFTILGSGLPKAEVFEQSQMFYYSAFRFACQISEWPKLHFHIGPKAKAEDRKIFGIWPNTKAEAEYWNFPKFLSICRICWSSWRPNSEKLRLWSNTSAFGRPLHKIIIKISNKAQIVVSCLCNIATIALI